MSQKKKIKTGETIKSQRIKGAPKVHPQTEPLLTSVSLFQSQGATGEKTLSMAFFNLFWEYIPKSAPNNSDNSDNWKGLSSFLCPLVK